MSDARSSKRSVRGSKPDWKTQSAYLRDPVARKMVYAAIILVILFLATLVGALFTGVLARDDMVNTTKQREVVIARSGALAPGASAAAWAPYIDALVASGDLRQAQITLEHAKSTLEGTETVPAIDLSEARLLWAQERYEAGADSARTAMNGFVAEQQARLDRGGETAARAAENGVDSRYFDAVLVAATCYSELERWEDAVEMYDVYLRYDRTASDIFIDRGNAKLALEDFAGAEADFNEALRFVPYSDEARAGLEKIGAVK